MYSPCLARPQVAVVSFLSLCVGSLSTQVVFAEGDSRQVPWYQERIVGMEVGPTGAQFGYSDPADARYCSKWDGAEIVRECVAANAEYLVLWLRDGDFAYYNSSLLPKAPGYRHDMPNGATWDRAWDDMLEFRYQSSERMNCGNSQASTVLADNNR